MLFRLSTLLLGFALVCVSFGWIVSEWRHRTSTSNEYDVASESDDPLPIPNWKMAQSMDSDQNGMVSKKEFLSSGQVFDFIDQDRDGALTRNEVLIARKSTPAPPNAGDPAPSISALDPKTGKMVKLHNRGRPFALIFGTHT